jgi:cholesterol oxidase
MSEKFDAIVIGSGFGGSILACRLAEKGHRVLVLERGRRWTPAEYPRKPGDHWVYDARHPEKRNGWLDLRFFKHMLVAQAAGVGGGSLTYSSVHLEAHPQLFDRGWPEEVTHAELKPHYDSVAAMLSLQTLPDGQLPERFKLARDAAASLGHAQRFSKATLAVSFSPDWHYELDDPFDRRHSKTFTNAQGQRQGTCIHLGNCDIGCDVLAKNSVELTYLAAAERKGCDVRPLHVVRSIEPRDGGYRVEFDRIEKKELTRGDASADRVFVAAGSLGSTEILLRARDEHKTLPNLSAALGKRWSPNANVLSLARYPDSNRVRQSVGPTINAVVDFMDGEVGGERFVVEDDGFPSLMLNVLRASMTLSRDPDDADPAAGRALFDRLDEATGGKDATRGLMLWLGAGIDAGDGELRLDRSWVPPFRQRLGLEWNADRSSGVIDAIEEIHRQMTKATGGKAEPDLSSGIVRSLLTLHPLGGCAMASTPEHGVVDHLGQVFGYPNLYVVDGAIVPTPIGRNPSHTIAALAERIAAHL